MYGLFFTTSVLCIGSWGRRIREKLQGQTEGIHRNVLTIYEIEQADGRYFIATEFVEGETLRQRLKGGHLGPCEARARAGGEGQGRWSRCSPSRHVGLSYLRGPVCRERCALTTRKNRP